MAINNKAIIGIIAFNPDLCKVDFTIANTSFIAIMSYLLKSFKRIICQMKRIIKFLLFIWSLYENQDCLQRLRPQLP